MLISCKILSSCAMTNRLLLTPFQHPPRSPPIKWCTPKVIPLMREGLNDSIHFFLHHPSATAFIHLFLISTAVGHLTLETLLEAREGPDHQLNPSSSASQPPAANRQFRHLVSIELFFASGAERWLRAVRRFQCLLWLGEMFSAENIRFELPFASIIAADPSYLGRSIGLLCVVQEVTEWS